MTAIAVLAFLSLFTTTGLALYLGYRIVVRARHRYRKNQLMILVFNLMLADMQQAVGFMLESHWLRIDTIESGSGACWVQGWFKSIGNLSSGLFCLAIGVHTLVYVSCRYQLRTLHFYFAIVLVWAVVFGFAFVGLGMHPDDLYVRAGIAVCGQTHYRFYSVDCAWTTTDMIRIVQCWINPNYAHYRNWLYFNAIGVVDVASLLLYGALFVILRRRVSSGHYDQLRAAKAITVSKIMFIYPLAYVACTVPIVILPLLSASGNPPTTTYVIAASAAITSVGWIDVLIYTLTRRLEPVEERADTSDIDPLDTFDSWWAYSSKEGLYGTTATCVAVGPNKPESRGDDKELLSDSAPMNTVRAFTTVKVSSAPLDVEAMAGSEDGDDDVDRMAKSKSGENLNGYDDAARSKRSF